MAHIASAYGTLLCLRQVEYDFVPKLVNFDVTLHEPVPVDTDKMESVEAIVDAHEVTPLRELRFKSLFIRFTESLETDRTPAAQVIIVIRHYFLQGHVHVVNLLLVLFNLFVAMLIQAFLYVFLDIFNLIIIEALRVVDRKCWCLFRILQTYIMSSNGSDKKISVFEFDFVYLLTESLKSRRNVRWTAILLESSPTCGLNLSTVSTTLTGVSSRGGATGAFG